MTKTVTASEAKTKFYNLLSKVSHGGIEFIVTWNGKPVAILTNLEDQSQLKETIDVLSNPEMMHQIASSQRFYKQKKKDRKAIK